MPLSYFSPSSRCRPPLPRTPTHQLACPLPPPYHPPTPISHTPPRHAPQALGWRGLAGPGGLPCALRPPVTSPTWTPGGDTVGSPGLSLRCSRRGRNPATTAGKERNKHTILYGNPYVYIQSIYKIIFFLIYYTETMEICNFFCVRVPSPTTQLQYSLNRHSYSHTLKSHVHTQIYSQIYQHQCMIYLKTIFMWISGSPSRI